MKLFLTLVVSAMLALLAVALMTTGTFAEGRSPAWMNSAGTIGGTLEVVIREKDSLDPDPDDPNLVLPLPDEFGIPIKRRFDITITGMHQWGDFYVSLVEETGLNEYLIKRHKFHVPFTDGALTTWTRKFSAVMWIELENEIPYLYGQKADSKDDNSAGFVAINDPTGAPASVFVLVETKPWAEFQNLKESSRLNIQAGWGVFLKGPDFLFPGDAPSRYLTEIYGTGPGKFTLNTTSQTIDKNVLESYDFIMGQEGLWRIELPVFLWCEAIPGGYCVVGSKHAAEPGMAHVGAEFFSRVGLPDFGNTPEFSWDAWPVGDIEMIARSPIIVITPLEEMIDTYPKTNPRKF